MIKALAFVASFLWCAVLSAADADTDWVQQSNALARPALEVIAKYNPEAAGRYGLDGYDEAILDLRANVYERSRDDAGRVLSQLQDQLGTQQHPKVKQDLELLIQVLTDRLARDERSHRLLLPYINVAEIVFENTRALLDPNVDKSRHGTAPTPRVGACTRRRSCSRTFL